MRKLSDSTRHLLRSLRQHDGRFWASVFDGRTLSGAERRGWIRIEGTVVGHLDHRQAVLTDIGAEQASLLAD